MSFVLYICLVVFINVFVSLCLSRCMQIMFWCLNVVCFCLDMSVYVPVSLFYVCLLCVYLYDCLFCACFYTGYCTVRV